MPLSALFAIKLLKSLPLSVLFAVSELTSLQAKQSLSKRMRVEGVCYFHLRMPPAPWTFIFLFQKKKNTLFVSNCLSYFKNLTF